MGCVAKKISILKTSCFNEEERNQRDWTNGLPPDLVRLISKKLSGITSFIRFRAVCNTWRFSTSASDSPAQLPWLFEEVYHYGKEVLRFYSISSNQSFTIPVPTPLVHKSFTGSSSGYLFAHDLFCKNLSLFNPISGDEVNLPCLNVSYAFPVHVSSDPIRSGVYVLGTCLSVCKTKYLLAFYGPGDEKWVFMEWGVPIVFVGSYAVYNRQLFHSEPDTYLTKISDIITQSVVHMVPRPENETWPLCDVKFVESAGEILRVIILNDICKLYKLNIGNDEEQPRWIEIDSIGDRVLFIEKYQSFSLTASEFPNLKGNCIYYLNDNYRPCKYNIEDQTTVMLDCPFERAGGWFIPKMTSLPR